LFERFTERGRQVMVHAQEESQVLRHGHIGTEHLLLGVVRVDPSLLPVPIARARDRVIALRGRGDTDERGMIPFTPEAKRALELAVGLAAADQPVGPAHLLIALYDAEHTVAELIADFGLQPIRIREHAQAVADVIVAPLTPLETLRSGAPLSVILGHGSLPIGDFGNPRVDARLLLLMLRADTRIGQWLRSKGIDEDAILAEVPTADDEP
jgi:ATP-dependent Clp protease ATP-binding subunit ClpC